MDLAQDKNKWQDFRILQWYS